MSHHFAHFAQGTTSPQLHAQAQGQQQATPPVTKRYVTREELEGDPHCYVLQNMAKSRNPILGIKYIREVTGWGLKESKNYWDDSEYARIYQQAHVEYVKIIGCLPSGYQPTLGKRILAILNEPYSAETLCEKIREVAQYYESMR